MDSKHSTDLQPKQENTTLKKKKEEKKKTLNAQQWPDKKYV